MQIVGVFLVALFALLIVLAIIQIVKKLRGTAVRANSTAAGWFLLLLSFVFLSLTEFSGPRTDVFTITDAKETGTGALGPLWWRWPCFGLIFFCGAWLLSGDRRLTRNTVDGSKVWGQND